MLRRTPLLAAVALALGATGAAISAAAPASARPASASAVRVSVPCGADPARVLLVARETANGGSFAKTTLTGLKQRRWMGATVITGPSRIDQDLQAAMTGGDESDPPVIKIAHHGRLSESTTSPLAWPHLGIGEYFSANATTLCVAVVQVRPHGITAGGISTAVDVRPREHVVRGWFDARPKSRWRVTATVTTATGVQSMTRRVRGTSDGLDLRFTGFKALSTYTKVRLRAVSLKTHQVQRLTLSRTV